MIATCVGKAKILHYPVLSSQALSNKYEVLGDFGDSWFAGRARIPPTFHRDCRNAFALASAQGGQVTAQQAAAKLFWSQVALPETSAASRELALDVCALFDVSRRLRWSFAVNPKRSLPLHESDHHAAAMALRCRAFVRCLKSRKGIMTKYPIQRIKRLIRRCKPWLAASGPP